MSIELTELFVGSTKYCTDFSKVTLKEDVIKGYFRISDEKYATDIGETWKNGLSVRLASIADGNRTTLPLLKVKRGSLACNFIYQPLGKSYTQFDFTLVVSNPVVERSVEDILQDVIAVFE